MRWANENLGEISMKKILAMTLAVASLFAAVPAQAATQYTTKILIEGGWHGLGATASEARTSCYADGSDLDSGTRVVVKSGSNKILATGKLAWRVLEVQDRSIDDSSYLDEYSIIRYEATCQLYASVKVPKSNFYTFTFGTVDGGSYSFNDMKSEGWILGLTFG
jgi:hypothetical protein